MKRRLRKKKGLGEFRIFCLELTMRLRPETDFNAFLDFFIDDCIEANGLQFGGGGGGPEPLTLAGIVELGHSRECESNHTKLLELLRENESIESSETGDIVDDHGALHLSFP